jgi:polysaccharide pyruvyl transferase WcaK-like protein
VTAAEALHSALSNDSCAHCHALTVRESVSNALLAMLGVIASVLHAAR